MTTETRAPSANSMIRRIVWAVDPFESARQLERQAFHELEPFLQDPAVELYPVYVLSPGVLNLPVDLGTPWPWLDEYKFRAQKAILEQLTPFHSSHLQPPTVLVRTHVSISQSVTALVDFAREKNADLIVANSHGRSGMSRFFLGSFAETLLNRSDIPVMIVGAKNRPAGTVGFDHVLFPTEFGEHSKETFRGVVNLARLLGARLTIFHAVPLLREPVVDIDDPSRLYPLEGERVSLRTIIDFQVERQKRHAEAWKRWAENEGVQANAVIDTSGQNIGELIENYAVQQQVGLIMMEAQSGPLQAALLGSVTHKVVRTAPCPVWVFTAKAVEQAEARKKAA